MVRVQDEDAVERAHQHVVDLVLLAGMANIMRMKFAVYDRSLRG